MKKLFVGLFMMFALSACGAEQIDTGNRGVRTSWGEIISQTPLTEGLYFYNPFGGNIIEYDCKTQKFDVELETYTKDMQTASLTVVVNYNLIPDDVITVHKTVGKAYESKISYPQAISIVKDVIGQWDASSLIENRDKATKQILELMKLSAKQNHINISDISIKNIDYSDTFEQAIEAKVVATQKAEESKNRTVQVKEEANQKLIEAQAEAESMKIRSQALSQNQNLVAYEAVQRWDGKLPVNIYGSAPIPFIGNLK